LDSILSISQLLSLATNQTNQITRFSAQLVIDKYLTISSLFNESSADLQQKLAIPLITITENIRTVCVVIN
jgi:hypothetical protein